jgi:hypothetical protein
VSCASFLATCPVHSGYGIYRPEARSQQAERRTSPYRLAVVPCTKARPTPVLPFREGLLIMPIIRLIDSERASTEGATAGVHPHKSCQEFLASGSRTVAFFASEWVQSITGQTLNLGGVLAMS